MLQVARGRTYDPTLTRKATRNKPTCTLQLAEANSQINAFLDGVDDVIRERHCEMYRRMCPCDLQENRQQYLTTECRWHVDSKAPGRFA